MTNTKHMIFVMAGTVIFSVSAIAQDTRDGELAEADSDLNNVYKKIMAQLGTAEQQQLRAAQRAWIQMRDADCRWAFTDQRDCLIDRTTNRAEELKNTYFSTKDRQYKSLRDSK